MSGEDARLARGAHRDAAEGRCLMEHVSVLAGEPFGALPRCTHPALAALAAQVNDRVSDAARDVLVRRAPALSRAHTSDPALTWRFVEHAARGVLLRRPGDPVAARRLRRALRARRHRDHVLPPRLLARLPRWSTTLVALAALDELVTSVHALSAASGPAGSASRDRALVELLDTAIAVTIGPDDSPRRSARPGDSPRRSAPPGSALAVVPPLEEVSAA